MVSTSDSLHVSPGSGKNPGFSDASLRRRIAGLVETDFARLGVRTHECRPAVLRTAARRIATKLADEHIASPNPLVERKLTEVMTATYRVLDPRRRSNRIQQVQVGRIQPVRLEAVAKASFHTAEENFCPSEEDATSLDDDFVDMIAEADAIQEVFRQMQWVHRRRPWRQWLTDWRFVLGLTGSVLLVAAWLATWQNGLKPVRAARGARQTSVSPASETRVESDAEVEIVAKPGDAPLSGAGILPVADPAPPSPPDAVKPILLVEASPSPSESGPSESGPSEPGPSVPGPSSVPSVFDDADVLAEADRIFLQTEGALAGFTKSQVSDLISRWQAQIDEAAEGSLLRAACAALLDQSDWLVDNDHRRSGVFPVVDDADDAARAVASWSACRSRLSATSDFNWMLARSNVLIDQLVLAGHSRLIGDLMFEAERLSRFCDDAESIAELEHLRRAMDTNPSNDEIQRLRDLGRSPGLIGRTMCLHLRQWNDGLAFLCKTSEPALAAIAKAELDWRMDHLLRVGTDSIEDAWLDDAERESLGKLGKRWSRATKRLSDREAASARLHAIELLNCEKSSESMELAAELETQLPRYLRNSVGDGADGAGRR